MKPSYGIVVDWETSGIRNNKKPYLTFLEQTQGIEIGATLVHIPTFETISEFESRVKFLGSHDGIEYGGPAYNKLTWSKDAEKIHGIKISDLIDAPTPKEVCESFINWLKINGVVDTHKSPLMFCGHNPSGDYYATMQLLFLGQHENDIRFHYRTIDSFTAGYFIFGTKNSNDLFKRTSNVQRKIHSAMEDSRLTTIALRTIYEICKGLSK